VTLVVIVGIGTVAAGVCSVLWGRQGTLAGGLVVVQRWTLMLVVVVGTGSMLGVGLVGVGAVEGLQVLGLLAAAAAGPGCLSCVAWCGAYLP
jgi:hypothetical protein